MLYVAHSWHRTSPFSSYRKRNFFVHREDSLFFVQSFDCFISIMCAPSRLVGGWEPLICYFLSLIGEVHYTIIKVVIHLHPMGAEGNFRTADMSGAQMHINCSWLMLTNSLIVKFRKSAQEIDVHCLWPSIVDKVLTWLLKCFKEMCIIELETDLEVKEEVGSVWKKEHLWRLFAATLLVLNFVLLCKPFYRQALSAWP